MKTWETTTTASASVLLFVLASAPLSINTVSISAVNTDRGEATVSLSASNINIPRELDR